MKFYDVYYKGKVIKTYVASSKDSAVLMAKGDRLIYDFIKYSRI